MAESAFGRAGEALAAAREGLRAAEAALKAARAAVEDHEPACLKAREARDVRSNALKEFKEYDLACFELLRDQVAKKAAPAAAPKENGVPSSEEIEGAKGEEEAKVPEEAKVSE